MDVTPFRIERYYARYEFTTRYMLSSSDCESRTIGDLLALEPDAHDRLVGTWCGYTESPGALELREAIAALYERIDPDDVIVTSVAVRVVVVPEAEAPGAASHPRSLGRRLPIDRRDRGRSNNYLNVNKMPLYRGALDPLPPRGLG